MASGGGESPATRESRYLANYEEERFLGIGRYGSFVLCRNKLDKRSCAIKKISLKRTGVPFEKVRREVLIHSHLEHQYIVNYYTSWVEHAFAGWHSPEQAGEKDQEYDAGLFPLLEISDLQSPCLFILLGYHGRSLHHELVNKFPVDEERAIKIFVKLLEGLRYIHGMGYVHLSLKCQNIFMDCDDNPRIGDFGFARRILDDGDIDDIRVGSYIAPPETKERKPPTVKADIFAMGLVLFDLLHRDSDSNKLSAMQEMTNRGVLPDSQMLLKYKDVLLPMVARNPEARPTIDGVMEDLAPIVGVFTEDLHFLTESFRN